MAIAGASALVGFAIGAPALAGAMAKIKVSTMKLSFAIGEALKPQFEWFGDKLAWAAGWIDQNPDLFGKITSSVMILGGAFLAFKVGGVIAGGISALLGVAGGLIALVSSPAFLGAIAALGVAAGLWAYVKGQAAQAEAFEALTPPGMKDIEPTLQNRLNRGVFPSGTRQMESTGQPINPGKMESFSDYWNFGNNQENKKAMTMSWTDQV